MHIGGKTALEQHGYGHYVRLGRQQKVTLWKEPNERLPAWFLNHEWEVSLQLRSAQLFDDNAGELAKKKIDGLPLQVSSAEQAVIEYLYDIPKYESFDEANYIMEGMATLRPSVLQSLMEKCRSIKVKRLFLYLAAMYDHPWYKHLNEKSIGLGSGKREIIKGGKLDKKYQIVVSELNREEYENQVRLVLKILPFLLKADVFALKGGTAINFFVRDFPRLSVDIDLTYLPVKNRADSLKEISKGIQQIANEIKNRLQIMKNV